MASRSVFTAALVLGSMLSVRADGQALGMPETVVVQSGTVTLRGLLWLQVSARSGKVIRQYWIERTVPAAQPRIAADEASPRP